MEHWCHAALLGPMFVRKFSAGEGCSQMRSALNGQGLIDSKNLLAEKERHAGLENT